MSIHVVSPNSAVRPMRSTSHGKIRMSVGKHPTIVGNDRTEVAARFFAFLRGRYPIKTAEHVAGDLGISPAAVEKWFERGSLPSFLTFGKMGLVYGPEFVSTVFPAWKWAGEEARKQKIDRLVAKRAEADLELEKLLNC